MKRTIMALVAVAALTLGSSFMSTAQAGHPHHHHHHHHNHHPNWGYGGGYGGYGGYYQRPYTVGYNYRPAYPYRCYPYQSYGYGSGISIQGRNFGFRVGF